MSTDPIIWAAALCTILVYSYLYKENEFYKGTERLYVGVAAGYTMVMGYQNVVNKVWLPLTTKGQWWVLIPAIIGLLFFVQFLGPQYRWLRRFPIAITVGIGAAVNMRSSVATELIAQLRAAMMGLTSLDNIIVVIGTVAVLSYFFFTFKPNPVFKASSDLGKWVIMITFGAAFGNGIMGRISLLIGRLFLLFQDWIPLIKTR
jgi:hypothetical protein